MENQSSISSPDSKEKPGEDKVRWDCAGLVLDSGTDAEQETNFLLQKIISCHAKMMRFQTDTRARLPPFLLFQLLSYLCLWQQ
jgi:hypothetical protein